MKTSNQIRYDSELAKSLAAEDIRRGDMVAVLDMVYEIPSFMWNVEPHALAPDEPVRVRMRVGENMGCPLKVKAVCLPFILVASPSGQHGSLDVRLCRLVRLGDDYAHKAWKRFRKGCKKKRD